MILFSYCRYIVGLYGIGCNKTKMSFNAAECFSISNTVLCLLLARQTSVSGRLSPTPLVAAYKTRSRKRPALVTDTFLASRGCPLTRASTVPMQQLSCASRTSNYLNRNYSVRHDRK